MNLAFCILLFILLDCVTNESHFAPKGCLVLLTAFYQPKKALLIRQFKFNIKHWLNNSNSLYVQFMITTELMKSVRNNETFWK